MRIHRIVIVAVTAGLCLIVLRSAADEDRITRARSAVPPSPTVRPTDTPPPLATDCCAEAVQTNYPVPPLSERGNNCPSKSVPAGSSNVFDLESGRLEIDFYDVGHGRSRSFVLDVRDPDCFEHAATRGAIFSELVTVLSQSDTSDEGWFVACDRLRDAIRKGSLKLGERSFDLGIAQPYIGEICAG